MAPRRAPGGPCWTRGIVHASSVVSGTPGPVGERGWGGYPAGERGEDEVPAPRGGEAGVPRARGDGRGRTGRRPAGGEGWGTRGCKWGGGGTQPRERGPRVPELPLFRSPVPLLPPCRTWRAGPQAKW